MRGHQLAPQWRINRSMEASPKGLTVAELVQRVGIGLRTIYRDLSSYNALWSPLTQTARARSALRPGASCLIGQIDGRQRERGV